MNNLDLEAVDQIARLLDGRLAPEERARRLEEFGNSEDLAAVLAETAALLREAEAGGGSVDAAPDGARHADAPPELGTSGSGFPLVRPLGDSREARRGSRAARWGAPWMLAASLLIIAGGWWWSSAGGREDSDALRWQAVLAVAGSAGSAGSAIGPSAPPFPETRGATPALSGAARATRLGVALADLQVQIARRDRRAGNTADHISALLADLPAAGALTAPFQTLRARVGAPADELAPTLRHGRAAAAVATDSIRLALAEWGELARYAMAGNDATFARTKYTERTLAAGAVALPRDDTARTSLAALRRAALPERAVERAAYVRRVEQLLRTLASGDGGAPR